MRQNSELNRTLEWNGKVGYDLFDTISCYTCRCSQTHVRSIRVHGLTMKKCVNRINFLKTFSIINNSIPSWSPRWQQQKVNHQGNSINAMYALKKFLTNLQCANDDKFSNTSHFLSHKLPQKINASQTL